MLADIFLQLVKKYAKDHELANNLWLEIFTKYADPKRHYHTIEHLEALIKERDINTIRLTDDYKLEKYLFGEKAVSHLKWFGAAMPHIELLGHISKIYPEVVLKCIKRVDSLFNENIINDYQFYNPNIIINKMLEDDPETKSIGISMIQLNESPSISNGLGL